MQGSQGKNCGTSGGGSQQQNYLYKRDEKNKYNFMPAVFTDSF